MLLGGGLHVGGDGSRLGWQCYGVKCKTRGVWWGGGDCKTRGVWWGGGDCREGGMGLGELGDIRDIILGMGFYI